MGRRSDRRSDGRTFRRSDGRPDGRRTGGRTDVRGSKVEGYEHGRDDQRREDDEEMDIRIQREYDRGFSQGMYRSREQIADLRSEINRQKHVLTAARENCPARIRVLEEQLAGRLEVPNPGVQVLSDLMERNTEEHRIRRLEIYCNSCSKHTCKSVSRQSYGKIRKKILRILYI